MTQQTFDNYLQQLDRNMAENGFRIANPPFPGEGIARIYHNRKGVLTKFSIVDTFCPVKYLPTIRSIEELAGFSAVSYDFGLRNKGWLPRGLGGCLGVYPLLVTDQVPPDLRSFVTRHYCPKHWAAFEFPVVLELPSKAIFFYEETPLWGAAYYHGFRKEVKKLFLPW